MRRVAVKNELEALQETVGGYIQTLKFADGVVLICNEEGKLLKLEPNTHFYTINGDFLLIGRNGEEFGDLTEKQMEQMERMFT
ncbi:MAG: DUF3846 domain-containing protein [Anaerotignum sp.]